MISKIVQLLIKGDVLMFNIFKKIRIAISNSVGKTDKSPNLVINYWKSPGEYFRPFDDEIIIKNQLLILDALNFQYYAIMNTLN